LTDATQRLTEVTLERALKVTISEICSLVNVDGIRGDITTNKAARALAALEGDSQVSLDHVRRVISLCLNHRWGPCGTPCLVMSPARVLCFALMAKYPLKGSQRSGSMTQERAAFLLQAFALETTGLQKIDASGRSWTEWTAAARYGRAVWQEGDVRGGACAG
jgi:hypothetical protein